MAETFIGKPYNDDGDIRTISSDVDPSQLVWHRDNEHRYVTILEGQGWQLQYNGWLPIELEEGKTYHIQKMLMHRLILGATDLKMRIEKDVEEKEVESPEGTKLSG